MRLPRLRFTVRWLVIVIALVSITLVLITIALRELHVHDFYFTVGKPVGKG